ncbi:MAG: hypothetical protein J2P38_10330 [Candidatus Dormibacteraeota bacterium]|nr:hypothetical protein [Candidatus Dormibacteraeota bacterium]
MTYTRNPALEELTVLAGEWELESPQYPDAKGRADFEWLEDGAFLVEHQGHTGQVATWIYGSDGPAEGQTVLYYDSRGITRVYRSTLRDRTWRVWRDAPDFSQRFTGRVAEDGNTIEGAWESATDGVHWEHDFDLTFTRVHERPA